MRRRVAAHAAAEGDGLAGDAAVEGAQDQLLRGCRVEDVETWDGLTGLRGGVGRARMKLRVRDDIPAQLTSERGAGSDL